MPIARKLSRNVILESSRSRRSMIRSVETITAEKQVRGRWAILGSDESIVLKVVIDVSKLKLFMLWWAPNNTAYPTSPNVYIIPTLDYFANFGANTPIIWTPTMGTPNPFTEDVTSFTVDGAMANHDGYLNLRILEDISEV